jgi:hypothetical protein
MKKIIYILSVFISISTFSQTPAFKTGEHLKYRLSYSNFFTAGYATMDVKKAKHKGNPSFHVIGKGKTTGMINWFFKVRDNYETYFEKETLLPYRFIRQIDEGGYTKDKEILFNQETHQATVLNKENKKMKTFETEKGVQDLLSSLYYMRNQDISNFKIGDEISLPIFLDEEIMYMKLRFLGREKIDTKFGEIKAAKFMPLVASDRVFKDEESVIVWVSDDVNKIPLRIKASLAVGSLRADLHKYNGLANPIIFED